MSSHTPRAIASIARMRVTQRRWRATAPDLLAPCHLAERLHRRAWQHFLLVKPRLAAEVDPA